MSKLTNKVILIGNLGKDIEVVQFQNGGRIGKATLATTETWKDRNGEKQKTTQWHDIVFWGKSVDIAAQYLRKGSKIAVEGSIEYNIVERQDQSKVKYTKIKVSSFEFLDSKPQTNNEDVYQNDHAHQQAISMSNSNSSLQQQYSQVPNQPLGDLPF